MRGFFSDNVWREKLRMKAKMNVESPKENIYLIIIIFIAHQCFNILNLEDNIIIIKTLCIHYSSKKQLKVAISHN